MRNDAITEGPLPQLLSELASSPRGHLQSKRLIATQEVCEGLYQTQQDITFASVARYGKELGVPARQTLVNATGIHYRKIIEWWQAKQQQQKLGNLLPNRRLHEALYLRSLSLDQISVYLIDNRWLVNSPDFTKIDWTLFQGVSRALGVPDVYFLCESDEMAAMLLEQHAGTQQDKIAC